MSLVNEPQVQKYQPVQNRHQVDSQPARSKQAETYNAPLFSPRYLGNMVTQQMPLIQRKCSCSGGAHIEGACPTCQRKRLSKQPNVIQPKLTIGPANDAFEQEADRVANAVVYGTQQYPGNYSRFGDNAVQRDEIKGDGSLPEEEIDETEDAVFVKLPSTPTSPATEEEQADSTTQVQRKASSGHTGGVGTLAALGSSSGQTLSSNLQTDMSSRFGADFSGVRVHTGTEADGMCKSIAARAFTYQNHIYFADNQYKPDTTTGKHLLAHELTHTIQQNATPVATNSGQTPVVQRKAGSSPTIQRAIDTSVLLHTFSLANLRGAASSNGTGTPYDTLAGIENAAYNSFSGRNPVLTMHLKDRWRYYADSFDFCRVKGTRSSTVARLGNCAWWHYATDDEYNLTFRYRHTATRSREGSFATASGRTQSRQTQISTGAKVSYSILELSASRTDTESRGSSATTTVTATNFYEHDYDVSLDYNMKFFNPGDFRMTSDFFPDMEQISGPHRRSGSVNVGTVTLYDDDSNPDNLTA